MPLQDTCHCALSRRRQATWPDLLECTVKHTLLLGLHRKRLCLPRDALADALHELHEAPQLTAALCPTSSAALYTCSRQLRKVVHNFTTALRIQSFRDVVSIAKGDWPQLCLIILPDQCIDWQAIWPAPGTQELLAHLFLATDFCTCHSPDCRPKDRPAAQTEPDSS